MLDSIVLYKPEVYGSGNKLDGFSENEIKEAKVEAHENLRLLPQHMHLNAFNGIWLGSNTYGLLKSLPHDMMHAYLHGVLMYVF